MYDGEIFSFTNFPLFGSDFFLLILTTLFLYMYAIGKGNYLLNYLLHEFLHSFICSHYCHFFDGMRTVYFLVTFLEKRQLGKIEGKLQNLASGDYEQPSLDVAISQNKEMLLVDHDIKRIKEKLVSMSREPQS